MHTLTVRDLVLGDGIPKICVPIVAHTAAELDEALERMDLSACDLAEFRADFYFEEPLEALRKIRERLGNRPVIYTIRTREEGGEMEIDEVEYESRNLAAASYADLADIQMRRLTCKREGRTIHSGIIRKLQDRGMKVICSWHDFSGTPQTDEMVRIMRTMQETGCDIPKLAVMGRDRRDVLRLIQASLEMQETCGGSPFITMSMGNLGKITRIAGGLTGSCITFGMAGRGSAPGQIPAADLRQVLKVLGA